MPEYDGADAFLDTVLEKLEDNPRSRQKMIGPSEVGHPCPRWLSYKLAGAPKGPELPPWRQFVGTAVDDKISGILAQDPEQWIIHRRVTIGELAPGKPITGTPDAYHIPTATIVDLKTPGPSAMKKFRISGEDPQYRAQVHSYAQGMINAGYPVVTVAVVRLPSAGEFSDAIVKREPFDPVVARESLERAQLIYRLIEAHGIDVVNHMVGKEHYCHRCQYFSATNKSNDMRKGCTGPEGRKSAIERDPTMGGLLKSAR